MPLKVKIVDLYNSSTRNASKALRYSTHFQGITQFYLHTLRFICKWNEPYLPLPSQPQLVLIYQRQSDGRLSGPWCKVAPSKIRTHNLQIANPALYHTATSHYKVITWVGSLFLRVRHDAIPMGDAIFTQISVVPGTPSYPTPLDAE